MCTYTCIYLYIYIYVHMLCRLPMIRSMICPSLLFQGKRPEVFAESLWPNGCWWLWPCYLWGLHSRTRTCTYPYIRTCDMLAADFFLDVSQWSASAWRADMWQLDDNRCPSPMCSRKCFTCCDWVGAKPRKGSRRSCAEGTPPLTCINLWQDKLLPSFTLDSNENQLEAK